MQTTIQGTELSVAILMDDINSAKEIASALRKNNILAEHFHNLDEFWVAINIQTPDLVIIDVTKMSQGTIQFRQHPKVIDQSLNYIFYSKESTKVLLQSTYGLKPFGYIHNDPSLSVQIMSLVERRREMLSFERDRKDYESRIQRLQTRSQRLISDRSSAEEFKAHFEFVRNFCQQLETEALNSDFDQVLLNKLEIWDGITGYGIYELSQSGQKLVSPESGRKKYHPFPALWLGQANQFGIESFAEDMARQVANDLFDSEPILLKIYAGHNAPARLLFISFREERMIQFPWDVFESLLSSSLRKLELFKQNPPPVTQFLPMWEALDYMDKIQQTAIESDTRIICLNLVPLVNVVKKRFNNKFFWSSFFNDFFIQMSGRLTQGTKLSLFGPWNIIFFVPKEELESEFHSLQSFTRQFSYWKFFEDNSQILGEEMMPNLKLLPASSAHYLRTFEKELESLGVEQEAHRVMSRSQQETRRLSL